MDDEFNETNEARDEHENSRVPKQLQPFQYRKGQSGNPNGRPPGISMKEYLKRKFNTMTDDEREEYLDGITKLDLIKMAEGNPENKTDVTTKGDKIESGVVILPAKNEDTLATPK